MIKVTLFLLMFLLFSCNIKRDTNCELNSENLFVIDPQTISEEKRHPLFKGDLLDSCRFVQLEVKLESLLGMIKKIEIDDNSIFVMDNNGKICSFSTNGNFRVNYGQIGSGPKEMRIPITFYLNKEKDYIAVFDYGRKCFFRYDYDGQLIEIIPTSENICVEMITNIGMLDSKLLMITYSNSYLVKESAVMVNESDYSYKRSMKQFMFHNKKENLSDENNKLTSGGLFVTGYADYSDIVYMFQNEQIHSAYLLKSNKQAVTFDLVSKSNVEDEFSFRKYLKQNGYTLGLTTIYATDNYLLLMNSDISIYFNKLTKGIFKDRLDYSPFYHVVDIKTTTNDAFVGVLYPYQLIEAREKTVLYPNSFLFEKDPRLEKILQEVEIEDNPIVSFYYPRE